MTMDEKKDIAGALEEVRLAREGFDAEMRALKRRQRAAVEKARKAIDKKKIEKVRKSLGL